MKISELMTTDVITCRTSDSLEVAAQLMWMYGIGSLPVVDDHGRVAGMLTDRDALLAAFMRREPLRAISAGSTMSVNPCTCSQGDEHTTIAAEMTRRHIRRVPVVDAAQHPVGMFSVSDLARASQRRAEVTPAEVAMLAAVGAPRAVGAAP